MKYFSQNKTLTKIPITRTGKFLFDKSVTHYLKHYEYDPPLKLTDKPNLIFTVAFGEEQKKAATLLYNTLRFISNYKDDIIIFVDSIVGLEHIQDKKVQIIIPTNIQEIKMFDISLYNVFMDKYISHSNYEQIMYLSPYTLCQKPVDCLFTAFNCFKYNEKSCSDLRLNTAYMTNEEKEIYKSNTKSVNYFMWCIDAALFPTMCNYVKNLIINDKSHYQLQKALNVFTKRQIVDCFTWKTHYFGTNNANIFNVAIHYSNYKAMEQYFNSSLFK